MCTPPCAHPTQLHGDGDDDDDDDGDGDDDDDDDVDDFYDGSSLSAMLSSWPQSVNAVLSSDLELQNLR